MKTRSSGCFFRTTSCSRPRRAASFMWTSTLITLPKAFIIGMASKCNYFTFVWAIYVHVIYAWCYKRCHSRSQFCKAPRFSKSNQLCPEGWYGKLGACYQVHPSLVDNTEASRRCYESGTELIQLAEMKTRSSGCFFRTTSCSRPRRAASFMWTLR